MGKPKTTGRTATDWLSDRAMRVVIRSLLFTPYGWRVPAMGWFVRCVLAPLAGYHRRSLSNLAYIFPDMSFPDRKSISRGVADNMGRTFIENYSTKQFLSRNKNAQLQGPGAEALKIAQQNGQAVILVSGHYGNYEAPRAALVGHGYNVGGLYRRAANRYFNDHYAQTMKSFGGPVFEQGHRGTAGFVRHLKSGGMLVLLFDQHVSEGVDLPFLGKPARTALSASSLALRYDALLIPFYGTRRKNGIDFDIEFEAPIPHSDPETMTRALNTSLETRIHKHPKQWFWVHRRWKVGRGRNV